MGTDTVLLSRRIIVQYAMPAGAGYSGLGPNTALYQWGILVLDLGLCTLCWTGYRVRLFGWLQRLEWLLDKSVPLQYALWGLPLLALYLGRLLVCVLAGSVKHVKELMSPIPGL